MDTELLEQLGQRIDTLIADRLRLRREVERLQAEAGNRGFELEAELAQAKAETEAARADLEAARAEIQERDGRIQAATTRVQALVERLQQD